MWKFSSINEKKVRSTYYHYYSYLRVHSEVVFINSVWVESFQSIVENFLPRVWIFQSLVNRYFNSQEENLIQITWNRIKELFPLRKKYLCYNQQFCLCPVIFCQIFMNSFLLKWKWREYTAQRKNCYISCLIFLLLVSTFL